MLNPFPDADKYIFKDAFVERYSKLTDWETYKKYSLSFLRKSIRINTLKITVEQCKKRLAADWNLAPVPWCKEGFFIEHKKGRLDVGNTIEHALGYYYVQEAASMIPPVVLGAEPGELILDLAAAPGSKTSQIAAMMNNQGLLIANDVKGERLAALGLNLQRIGASNVLVTLMQGQQFAKAGILFDRILLDAPCSGTGTIRKSPKTILMWNPDAIKRLVRLQQALLKTAWSILKPGGTLVYSTCSTEPEENEGVISNLLDTAIDARIEEIHLPIKHGPAITEFEGTLYHKDVRHCLRLWPQDNDTEGFFVTKLKKQ